MTSEDVGHRSDVASPAQGDAKVEQLRKLMAAADGGKGVQAYIIPSEDPHMVLPEAKHDILASTLDHHTPTCFSLTQH